MTNLARANRHLATLEARELFRKAAFSTDMPLEFLSQFGEDAEVWWALGRQTQGFFIEAGAYDGVHFSVTYALEAMGWRGLLVEPIPERHAQCAAARPHSRSVHAALGPRGGAATMELSVTGDAYDGMCSFGPGCNAHREAVRAAGIPTRTIEVPVACLDDLLDGHDGPIDLAVIDVEGAEVDVLRGFDLLRWKPRVLLVEDNDDRGSPALTGYMSVMPYVETGWVGVSRMFVHAGEREVLDRIKWGS